MKGYQRLTKRNGDGKANYATPIQSDFIGAVYEECNRREGEILSRLCEIEDKIESGQFIELPYAPDRIDVGFTQTVRSIRDDSVELRTPIYIALRKDTLEEASAMLKELEQNAAERDDNADAIIYGLRTVIDALKADKNPEER